MASRRRSRSVRAAAGSNSAGFTWHLRERWGPWCIRDAGRLITFGKLEQSLKGSGRIIDHLVRVSVLVNVGDRVGHRQITRFDMFEIVPAKRRRHGGRRSWTWRPCSAHRAIATVLVEVDKDPFSPFFLPPRSGDKRRDATLQLARQRDRSASHLDEVPPRSDANQHVDPSLARGLGPAGEANIGEELMGGCCRSPDISEDGTWGRVEVDPQLVGAVRLPTAGGPG